MVVDFINAIKSIYTLEIFVVINQASHFLYFCLPLHWPLAVVKVFPPIFLIKKIYYYYFSTYILLAFLILFLL